LRRRSSWNSSAEPRRSTNEDEKLLGPVVIPTLYFIIVFQLILQAGVFYFAYKVTKLTGSFRAWTLIIAAFALLTISNVISLILSLSLPINQLSSLIETAGVATVIATSSISVAASVALFFGMFGLVKRFESQAKGS
jgi:hypothetical protein